MYPEVAVFYKNKSKDVYIRSGDTWEKVNHNPWFLVNRPKVPKPSSIE